MNYPDVKTLLPHRYPILLVDEITALDPGRSIRTSFYVDPALPVFAGHFPNDPVFPGVYSIEAMTQTGVCLLMTDEKNTDKVPLFLGINEARFLKAIRPGSTLELSAEIVSFRKDKQIFTLKETAAVNGETAACCEAVVILK